MERRLEHRREAYERKLEIDASPERKVSAACDYLRGAIAATGDHALAVSMADQLVAQLLSAADALTAEDERLRRAARAATGPNAQAGVRARRARLRWLRQ